MPLLDAQGRIVRRAIGFLRTYTAIDEPKSEKDIDTDAVGSIWTPPAEPEEGEDREATGGGRETHSHDARAGGSWPHQARVDRCGMGSAIQQVR
jgi:hypothetical protein